MGLCARATEDELTGALASFLPDLSVTELRPVQTGLVMLRGRMGGRGTAFHLGEATVTRAAVKINGTLTGFSHILGRSHQKARLAAIVDALMQNQQMDSQLEVSLLQPLRRRIASERQDRNHKVASTRVDFFTMVRGEDQ